MSAVKQIDIRARRRATGQAALPPAGPQRPGPQRLGPQRPGQRAYSTRRATPAPLVSARARNRVVALLVLTALAAGAYAGWSLWRSGAIARVWTGARDIANTAYDALPRLPGFTIQDVTVEGRTIVSREAVMAALDVRRGDPLLQFDAGAARRRLESIEWVEEAVIERRLPDAIYVRIKERSAVALWQRAKDFVLIDRQGRAVRTVDANLYGYLPLIVGPGAPEKITDLFLLLVEEPDIGKRVRAAVWVGGRRWTLTLDNGLEIMLPEEDAAAALKRLAALDRSDKLLSRDLASIDLRLPDRLFVRPIKRDEPGRPGDTPTAGSPGAHPSATPGTKPAAVKPADGKPARPPASGKPS